MHEVKKQFIYVLKLLPHLLDESKWTQKEEDIVNRHSERLQMLLDDGKLILAGRTLNMDVKTFGIVILEVDSEEEAQTIMRTDPSVAESVMTAELFPYRVALIKSNNNKLNG
jgi:uncharacterized protein YciI